MRNTREVLYRKTRLSPRPPPEVLKSASAWRNPAPEHGETRGSVGDYAKSRQKNLMASHQKNLIKKVKSAGKKIVEKLVQAITRHPHQEALIA